MTTPLNTRRRVCLLVDTVGHDAGAELQVTETAMHLDRERFEVYICCFEDSPRLQKLAQQVHVRTFPLRSVYTLNGLAQLWAFRRYLNANQIHIVHTYMEKSAIFGVLAVIGSRRRIVLTSRLNMGYWYTPFYRRFFWLLDHFTTRIVANSEAVKQATLAAERVDPNKVDVVYQGVDSARCSSASGDAGTIAAIGVPPNADVIGIVANLRPEKDVELFLRAARRVADEIPQAVFLIVGTGALRPRLDTLTRDMQLTDKVFFSNGRGEVRDYLQRMCIGCLTSQGEGFSNAILEYMAAGLPVVATDVGGNREAVLDEQTGYLVRERQPEDFAKPIIRLLKDPALRASMGRQGKDRCSTLFDLSVTVRKLEAYYVSLSAPGAAKPIRVLTTFQHFPPAWTSGSHTGTAQMATGCGALLKKSSQSDIIIVNGDVATVLSLVLTFLLFPFLKKPIIAVDLVMRKPEGGLSRIIAAIKKVLFKRVDHFVHYFRDLKGYERYYGIGPDRSSFMYFKANLYDRYTNSSGMNGDGDYILCFGRSLRDYDTFFDAVTRLPYPTAIARPNFKNLLEHGARFSRPLADLPQQLILLDDDGTSAAQLRLLERARIVVVPILRQTLCASGVGTYLNAMLMGKCVIISEGPGVSELLTDHQAILVPPEDPAALSAAIRTAWEDRPLREKVAHSGKALAASLGGEQAFVQRILDTVIPKFYAS